MAEGLARAFRADAFEAYSAGTNPGVLDELAALVMREIGADIRKQRPKHIREVEHIRFDYVITLCDSAAESCPVFPNAGKTVHRPFPDPPMLARECRDHDQALDEYRKVRDAIRILIESLPESLSEFQKA